MPNKKGAEIEEVRVQIKIGENSTKKDIHIQKTIDSKKGVPETKEEKEYTAPTPKAEPEENVA